MRLLAWSTLLLWGVASATPTITSSSTSTPHPGITLREWTLANPRNRVKIAEISLCHDGVEVVATAAGSSRRTPGSFASLTGVELAVNGDFYKTNTSTPVVAGDAVGGGVRWPAAQTVRGNPGEWWATPDLYGWIGFGPDFAEFSHTHRVKTDPAYSPQYGWRPDEVTQDIPSGLTALVSGFPELVVEGRKVTCSSPTSTSCFPDRADMRARHPRTAMGLSEDRRTFYLVTVDGRSSSSSGMYGTELADLMHHIGAYVAFNLDGGGSTAMWSRGRGYVNTPSDGSARPVANHWGVHATGGGAPESCFQWGGCRPYPVPGAENALFKDMPPGAFGANEAAILYRQGVTDGCNPGGDLMFCPNCGVTRGQFVKLLLAAADIPLDPLPASPTFTDVPLTHTFARSIETAARLGITQGCGGGRFCVDDPVTRAHAAAFIRRTQGWPAGGNGTPTFADVPVTHRFYGDIEAMSERCVTNGCGDGNYCPDRAMERDEAAIFIARAFDLEDSNACWSDTNTDPDTDADTSADTDADTSPDTDADTSADTDADTSADTDLDTDWGTDPDTDIGTDDDMDTNGDPSADVDADTTPSPADPTDDERVIPSGGCMCGTGRTTVPWALLAVLPILVRRRSAMR